MMFEFISVLFLFAMAGYAFAWLKDIEKKIKRLETISLRPSGLSSPQNLAWDGTNLYCVDNEGKELWLIDTVMPKK